MTPNAVSASVPDPASTQPVAAADIAAADNSTGPARLTFVTGKGGVGKTTVAAGMARRAAANGNRTLAVDVAASGQLRAAVADVEPPVLDLTTEASIDEYVKLYLKVPIAPSSLPVLAGIFDFVSSAAPAVREILTVGKIGYEAVYGPWDRIVVDGPATGHIVELLTAPDDLQKLAPAGPLANQTGWLRQALAAPSTDVVVVAQPEDLIVNETAELVERITADTDVAIGAVVVNRLMPELSDAALGEATVLAGGRGALASATSLLLAEYQSRLDRLTDLVGLADRVGVPLMVVDESPDDPVSAVVASLTSDRWQ